MERRTGGQMERRVERPVERMERREQRHRTEGRQQTEGRQKRRRLERWAAAPQTGVAREPQLLQPGGRTGPAEAPGSAAAQSARMQLCGGVTQTP